ncbi:hypothetical protein [Clostridium grantii]|uniref:Uncharacterized protein n=1 Tax=Clostridium grantii DSM 8605 TaxID=1121316 RepID=A0A1M5WCC4_9CLOT|nr:hypothetical protein [Clostridium grantii]SHH85165.1 hypothetical protein SAMN02745207_02820 [Clostridium grantii DSM 8605]
MLLTSLLLIFSLTSCSGNNENNQDVVTNNASEKTDKAITNNQENKKDFQSEEIEADPFLNQIAEKILANEELFEEVDEETKLSMIMPMNNRIIQMVNENFGYSLVNGIIISNEEIGMSITIYESTNAQNDVELLKNPPNNEEMFSNKQKTSDDGEKSDIDKENKPEGQGERPQNAQGNIGRNMNIFPDMESSEVLIVGNYIIISKTDDNSKVFEICEAELNNAQ